MDVSIGVMAYNEERNISYLLDALLNQKTKKINIEEIIIISSGSIDKTNNLVKNVSKKNKKIKLIIEKERTGKSHAINLFLKKAKNTVLVLESADTIPNRNTIENLCLPLLNKRIGMIGGKSIPKNRSYFFKKISEIIWRLHHEIAKQKPKFGEIIAFRNIINNIPQTAVDEEEIASIIKKKELKLIYEPEAIIYNKGPETIVDFIRQRRRIFCGHLKLKKRTGYSASTMNAYSLFKIVVKYLLNNPNKIVWILITFILEQISRLLGLIDFIRKKDYFIWKISKSTKQLSLGDE